MRRPEPRHQQEERVDRKSIQEVEGMGIGVGGAMLTTSVLAWVPLRMLMLLVKAKINREWADLEAGHQKAVLSMVLYAQSMGYLWMNTILLILTFLLRPQSMYFLYS